jgi:hypothetical protein
MHIETAARVSADLTPYLEVAQRSGLSLERVCELAAQNNLGEAVRLIEVRRANNLRRRKLELAERAHPSYQLYT